MKNKRNIAIYGLLILELCTGRILADWNMDTAVDREYNTNPFRYVSPAESWSTLMYAVLQTSFDGRKVSYSGLFETFDQITSRDYYWHQLQFSQIRQGTSWGLGMSQRFGKSTFQEYNYSTVKAFYNHKLPINVFSLYFHGNVEGAWYSDLDEYNNIKTNIGLRLHHTFPTKTTVIIAVYTNHTQYLTPVISAEAVGMRGGRWSRNFETESEYYPSITQGVLRTRFAQSVMQGTGIALQYDVRILAEKSEWSDSGVPSAFTDLAIWDDPARYRGYTVGGELTQLLPWHTTLKIAGYRGEKEFIHQMEYFSPDSIDYGNYRTDNLCTVWISLEKTFQSDLEILNNLTLSVYGQWIDNTSTSYWYTYTMRYTSLGLEYRF